MIHLWHRFRAWKRGRDLLLVCAGSGPGRVPLAMVSRTAASTASISGRHVRFHYPLSPTISWHFIVMAKSEPCARTLLDALTRKKISSIHPNDEIDAILFYRDDWGDEPQWIGGDLSLAKVSSSDYIMNSNQAYIHKQQGESDRNTPTNYK